MRFWFIPAFSFLFAVYSASGAKITNNSATVPAKTDGKTVVCNQYIGQDTKAHEAIKKLDEKLSKKLDQLIKLMQPSPGKNLNVSFLCFENSFSDLLRDDTV